MTGEPWPSAGVGGAFDAAKSANAARGASPGSSSASVIASMHANAESTRDPPSNYLADVVFFGLAIGREREHFARSPNAHSSSLPSCELQCRECKQQVDIVTRRVEVSDHAGVPVFGCSIARNSRAQPDAQLCIECIDISAASATCVELLPLRLFCFSSSCARLPSRAPRRGRRRWGCCAACTVAILDAKSASGTDRAVRMHSGSPPLNPRAPAAASQPVSGSARRTTDLPLRSPISASCNRMWLAYRAGV